MGFRTIQTLSMLKIAKCSEQHRLEENTIITLGDIARVNGQNNKGLCQGGIGLSCTLMYV